MNIKISQISAFEFEINVSYIKSFIKKEFNISIYSYLLKFLFIEGSISNTNSFDTSFLETIKRLYHERTPLEKDENIDILEIFHNKLGWLLDLIKNNKVDFLFSFYNDDEISRCTTLNPVVLFYETGKVKEKELLDSIQRKYKIDINKFITSVSNELKTISSNNLSEIESVLIKYSSYDFNNDKIKYQQEYAINKARYLLLNNKLWVSAYSDIDKSYDDSLLNLDEEIKIKEVEKNKELEELKKRDPSKYRRELIRKEIWDRGIFFDRSKLPKGSAQSNPYGIYLILDSFHFRFDKDSVLYDFKFSVVPKCTPGVKVQILKTDNNLSTPNSNLPLEICRIANKDVSRTFSDFLHCFNGPIPSDKKTIFDILNNSIKIGKNHDSIAFTASNRIWLKKNEIFEKEKELLNPDNPANKAKFEILRFFCNKLMNGYATEIQKPFQSFHHVISKTRNLNNDELGRLGEKLLYLFLKEKFSRFKHYSLEEFEECQIIWHNASFESRLPYDFTIKFNNLLINIDAKATRNSEETVFYLSIAELNEIIKNRQQYIIARITYIDEGQQAIGASIHDEFYVNFYIMNTETVEMVKYNIQDWQEHYKENSIRFNIEFFNKYEDISCLIDPYCQFPYKTNEDVVIEKNSKEYYELKDDLPNHIDRKILSIISCSENPNDPDLLYYKEKYLKLLTDRFNRLFS